MPRKNKIRRPKNPKYTCRVGDLVIHKGKKVLVQEVLDDGSEEKYERAFIKCCLLDPTNNKPLHRSNVFAGKDWRHVA